LNKVHNIRADLLFEFVNKFKLSAQVDDKFFFNLAKKHVDERRFNDAALII
jgi:hypothetical protein